MALYPDHVRPGDLITADFINSLLLRIAKLEQSVGQVGPTETVIVPTLVGEQFSRAAAILKQQGLNLGTAIDATGNMADPKTDKDRIVINQSPTQGSQVAPGTTVDIILAASEQLPELKPKPTIDHFIPAIAQLGGPVAIIGNNFVKLKKVTIDGGEVESYTDRKKPNTIGVRVPAELQSKPQPNENHVVVPVTVVTEGGGDTMGLTVQYKSIGKVPGIKYVQPLESKKPPKPGDLITIIGEEFSDDPDDVRVIFDGYETKVQYADIGKIVVKVPDTIDDTVKTKHGADISVSVSVKGVTSDVQKIFVREPTAMEYSVKEATVAKAKEVIGY